VVRAKDKVKQSVSIPSTCTRKFKNAKEAWRFITKGRVVIPEYNKWLGWLSYKMNASK